MQDEFDYDQFPDQQLQSMSQVAGAIDKEGHLQPQDLWGVQYKVFDISWTGSLEDFADNPKKTVFSIGSNMHQHLQHVLTLQNRANARAEDRDGNLAKAIILDARVLEQTNDAPVKFGIELKHMVPITIGRKAFNWTINPHCPTQAVGESAGRIFEPNDIFKRYMYEKLDKLDTARLKREIRLDQMEDGYVPYRTDGIAWQLLRKNVDQDVFPSFTEQFYDIEEDLYNSRRPRNKVDIPEEIATAMYTAIEAPLKQFEKSYVNLCDFSAKLHRADGEPFNSTMGLVGESYGAGADSKDEENSYNLSTVFHVGIKLGMHYVLRSE